MAKSASTATTTTAPTAVNTTSFDTAATETWITCGECANTLGLIVSAIKSFESAVNRDPANATALVGLSSSLRLNDISVNETIGSQAAIEKLNKSLESFPSLSKEANIFKELCECYLLVGLNDQAYQAIQSAIQLAPQDASLWLLSAQTLIRAGARAHATGSLAHCLSLLPDGTFSLTDIETARAAHAELAAISAADGNIELSIKELRATLELPPPPLSRIDEYVALVCALASALERDNDIPGAIKVCEDGELVVGNSPRILMSHAYLLLSNNSSPNINGAAEQAINLLTKVVDVENESAVQEGSDFLPWYLLGKANSYLDPRAAYDCYQVALRCASNCSIIWLAVGKLYLELKQLKDALEAYSQALKLQLGDGSNGTATAWDGLSCVYERCEDQLMDASDACNRAAACFKAMGDIKSCQFFEDRAIALEKASKKEGPMLNLRDPPDVPTFLIRDIVALAPNERITFTKQQLQAQQQAQQRAQDQVQQQQAQQQQAQQQAHQQAQQQQPHQQAQQQQAQQQAQQQQAQQQQQQQQSHNQSPVQPHHQETARNSPQVPIQTPQQQLVQYQGPPAPPQLPPHQQYLYPMPKNSPRQPQVSTPQIQHAWSPQPQHLQQPQQSPHQNQHQPQQPQQQQQPGSHQPQQNQPPAPQLPPHQQQQFFYPPPPLGPGQPQPNGGPHRSPMNPPQMNPAGAAPYAMGPGGPNNSAPGYYNYVSVPGGAQNLQYSSPNWRR